MKFSGKEYKVCVIGAGYVGTTLGASLSSVGIETVLVDVDKSKIDTLNDSQRAHFFETGLDELIRKSYASGSLSASTNLEKSLQGVDIIFSCVGTPDHEDGSVNLDYVFAVAEEVAKYAGDQQIFFVQRSTVPVGTGKRIKQIFNKVDKQNLNYISSPEFLREGSAIVDSIYPDRVVIGSDKEIAEVMRGFWQSFYSLFSNFEQTNNKYAAIYHQQNPSEIKYILTSIESAELIKVSANAFLSLKISFANNIALLCDKTGADVNEVMDGVGSDSRIGRSFLYAGLGYGGGCFPKDVSGLIKVLDENHVSTSILSSSVSLNDSLPINFANKIYDELKHHCISKVLVLGASFKAGTSDCRKSQAIVLANTLRNFGLQVSIFDPKASEKEIRTEGLAESILILSNLDNLANYEVIVIATEWPEFRNINWDSCGNLHYLFDGRNLIDKKVFDQSNVKYFGFGR